MGLQKDVFYLGWPTASSYMSPNAGGGGGCGASANEYSCTQGPNKLWRSNAIFNQWCQWSTFRCVYFWIVGWLTIYSKWQETNGIPSSRPPPLPPPGGGGGEAIGPGHKYQVTITTTQPLRSNITRKLEIPVPSLHFSLTFSFNAFSCSILSHHLFLTTLLSQG